MEELLSILKDNISRRPAMLIRDAAKLIYQNEMGGGHLITDMDACVRLMRREMESAADTGDPLYEPLGGDMFRLNIAPLAGRLSPETAARIFAISAQMHTGSRDRLREKMELLRLLGFDRDETDRYLHSYIAEGMPMVSHSAEYRNAYKPAYRVVCGEFIRALPLFMLTDQKLNEGNRVTVGIDGDCASGKTTLAELMGKVYSAPVYHADDYFLPPEKRTDERLSSPGGNMDRERLYDEVLAPIMRGDAPVTRRFDCRTLTLLDPVEHPVSNINIIEGSYCLHPDIIGAYTVTAALRVSPQEQLRRLMLREGESAVSTFISRWIPMEKQYSEETSLFLRTDTVIDT